MCLDPESPDSKISRAGTSPQPDSALGREGICAILDPGNVLPPFGVATEVVTVGAGVSIDQFADDVGMSGVLGGGRTRRRRGGTSREHSARRDLPAVGDWAFTVIDIWTNRVLCQLCWTKQPLERDIAAAQAATSPVRPDLAPRHSAMSARRLPSIVRCAAATSWTPGAGDRNKVGACRGRRSCWLTPPCRVTWQATQTQHSSHDPP